jgi:hypothetical protein
MVIAQNEIQDLRGDDATISPKKIKDTDRKKENVDF